MSTLSPNSYILETLDKIEGIIEQLDDDTVQGAAKRKRIESRMEDILNKMHAPADKTKRQKSSDSDEDNNLKKRYDKVIKGSENYIHVEEFVLALTSPVERGTKGENAALRRLLQGFSDEEKNWRSVLDPLAVSCDAWINRCQKHRLNDVLPDQDQQLLYYEKTIYQQATGAQVVQYIDHVIHLVETLKFIAQWNKHENNQGTKKWKTTLIRDSFCASSPQNDELWTTLSKKPKNQRQALKSAMKTFSSDHARRITTYNNLANVYEMFGPGIFLDLFWAPETPKSKTFRPFLEYLRQNMPVSENLKLSVYNYGRSADSLYCILEVLAGTEIAIFVQDFMKEYPPYLP